MSSEKAVADAISEMVEFFIPHCADVTTLNELRSMAADHTKWRKAHDLFDRIRNKRSGDHGAVFPSNRAVPEVA